MIPRQKLTVPSRLLGWRAGLAFFRWIKALFWWIDCFLFLVGCLIVFSRHREDTQNMEPWVPALTARCNGPTHLGHSLLDYHDHIGHESDWVTVVHRKAYRRWSIDSLASFTSSCFRKSQCQDLENESELIGSDDNDTRRDTDVETEALVDATEEWFPVVKGL